MKRKKRKPAAPPLSRLDRCVYYALTALTIAATFGLIAAQIGLTNYIGYRDPGVIAYDHHRSLLWYLPFLLFVMVSALVYIEACRTERKPLFGDKRIRYGSAPWDASVYPLFSKNKPRCYEQPSKKKLRSFGRRLWLGAALTLLCLVPFSLFGRDCLTQDYRVQDYNAVNRLSAEYEAGEISRIRLGVIRRTFRRYSSDYSLELCLIMEDGSEYSFRTDSFRDGAREALHVMQELKDGLPPEKVALFGKEMLWRLADGLHLDSEEVALLYRLFEAELP